uniref:Genome polyprotein n=1 Tax=Phenacoccus solenopsis associated flavi-like virus TaxID=3142498 RepID=A0AAT9JA66_9FLAV
MKIEQPPTFWNVEVRPTKALHFAIAAKNLDEDYYRMFVCELASACVKFGLNPNKVQFKATQLEGVIYHLWRRTVDYTSKPLSLALGEKLIGPGKNFLPPLSFIVWRKTEDKAWNFSMKELHVLSPEYLHIKDLQQRWMMTMLEHVAMPEKWWLALQQQYCIYLEYKAELEKRKDGQSKDNPKDPLEASKPAKKVIVVKRCVPKTKVATATKHNWFNEPVDPVLVAIRKTKEPNWRYVGTCNYTKRLERRSFDTRPMSKWDWRIEARRTGCDMQWLGGSGLHHIFPNNREWLESKLSYERAEKRSPKESHQRVSVVQNIASDYLPEYVAQLTEIVTASDDYKNLINRRKKKAPVKLTKEQRECNAQIVEDILFGERLRKEKMDKIIAEKVAKREAWQKKVRQEIERKEKAASAIILRASRSIFGKGIEISKSLLRKCIGKSVKGVYNVLYHYNPDFVPKNVAPKIDKQPKQSYAVIDHSDVESRQLEVANGRTTLPPGYSVYQLKDGSLLTLKETMPGKAWSAIPYMVPRHANWAGAEQMIKFGDLLVGKKFIKMARSFKGEITSTVEINGVGYTTVKQNTDLIWGDQTLRSTHYIDTTSVNWISGTPIVNTWGEVCSVVSASDGKRLYLFSVHSSEGHKARLVKAKWHSPGGASPACTLPHSFGGAAWFAIIMLVSTVVGVPPPVIRNGDNPASPEASNNGGTNIPETQNAQPLQAPKPVANMLVSHSLASFWPTEQQSGDIKFGNQNVARSTLAAAITNCLGRIDPDHPIAGIFRGHVYGKKEIANFIPWIQDKIKANMTRIDGEFGHLDLTSTVPDVMIKVSAALNKLSKDCDDVQNSNACLQDLAVVGGEAVPSDCDKIKQKMIEVGGKVNQINTLTAKFQATISDFQHKVALLTAVIEQCVNQKWAMNCFIMKQNLKRLPNPASTDLTEAEQIKTAIKRMQEDGSKIAATADYLKKYGNTRTASVPEPEAKDILAVITSPPDTIEIGGKVISAVMGARGTPSTVSFSDGKSLVNLPHHATLVMDGRDSQLKSLLKPYYPMTDIVRPKREQPISGLTSDNRDRYIVVDTTTGETKTDVPIPTKKATAVPFVEDSSVKKTAPWFGKVQFVYLSLWLLATLAGYEAGGQAGAFSIGVLGMAVFVRADCDPDLIVLQAKTSSSTVFEVRGTVHPGTCIRMGDGVFVVQRIYVQYPNSRIGEVATDVDYIVKSKYGCPFGKAQDVCKEEVADEKDYIVRTFCTHSWNGMFGKTDCATAGNLFYQTVVYLKPSSQMLFITLGSIPKVCLTGYHLRGADKQEITACQGQEIANGGDVNIVDVWGFKGTKFAAIGVTEKTESRVGIEAGRDFIGDCEIKDGKIGESCVPISVEQYGPDLIVKVGQTPFAKMQAEGFVHPITNVETSKSDEMVSNLQQVNVYMLLKEMPQTVQRTMCKLPRTIRPTVVPKKGELYSYSEVTIPFEVSDCDVRVQPRWCELLHGNLLPVNESKLMFNIVCDGWSSDTITVTGADSADIKLTGLTPEYDRAIHHVVQKVEYYVAHSEVGRALSGVFETILPKFRFMAPIWRAIKIAAIAVAVLLTLALAVKVGQNYSTLLGLLVGLAAVGIGGFEFAYGEPVCVWWMADRYGAQIPQLLAEHHEGAAIHGVWNLPRRSPIPCDVNDACTTFIARNLTHFHDLTPRNWGHPCGSNIHEYCKHGSNYGASPQEYADLVSELCYGSLSYTHQCRFDKKNKCNVLEQVSSAQIIAIGCKPGYSNCPQPTVTSLAFKSRSPRLHPGVLPTVVTITAVVASSNSQGLLSAFYMFIAITVVTQCAFDILVWMRLMGNEIGSLLDLFRMDYTFAVYLFDVLIDGILYTAAGYFLGPWALIVVFLVKRPQFIDNLSAIMQRRVRVADEFNYWWLAVALAKVWPRRKGFERVPTQKRNDLGQPLEKQVLTPLYRFVEHKGARANGGELVDALVSRSESFVPNISIVNGDCLRSGYANIVDNICVVPAHCLKNRDGFCIMGDVAVAGSYYQYLKVKRKLATNAPNCIVAQICNGEAVRVQFVGNRCYRLDRAWRRGDSGLLVVLPDGKLWIHRGCLGQAGFPITSDAAVCEHAGDEVTVVATTSKTGRVVVRASRSLTRNADKVTVGRVQSEQRIPTRALSVVANTRRSGSLVRGGNNKGSGEDKVESVPKVRQPNKAPTPRGGFKTKEEKSLVPKDALSVKKLGMIRQVVKDGKAIIYHHGLATESVYDNVEIRPAIAKVETSIASKYQQVKTAKQEVVPAFITSTFQKHSEGQKFIAYRVTTKDEHQEVIKRSDLKEFSPTLENTIRENLKRLPADKRRSCLDEMADRLRQTGIGHRIPRGKLTVEQLAYYADLNAIEKAEIAKANLKALKATTSASQAAGDPVTASENMPKPRVIVKGPRKFTSGGGANHLVCDPTTGNLKRSEWRVGDHWYTALHAWEGPKNGLYTIGDIISNDSECRKKFKSVANIQFRNGTEFVCNIGGGILTGISENGAIRVTSSVKPRVGYSGAVWIAQTSQKQWVMQGSTVDVSVDGEDHIFVFDCLFDQEADKSLTEYWWGEEEVTPLGEDGDELTEVNPSVGFHQNIGDVWECADHYTVLHCISADAAMSRGFANQVINRGYARPRPSGLIPEVLLTTNKDGHRCLHLVTKAKKSDKPDLEIVVQAFAKALKLGEPRIVMPEIGCGLDGLYWPTVSMRLAEEVNKLDVKPEVLALSQDEFATNQMHDEEEEAPRSESGLLPSIQSDGEHCVMLIDNFEQEILTCMPFDAFDGQKVSDDLVTYWEDDVKGRLENFQLSRPAGHIQTLYTLMSLNNHILAGRRDVEQLVQWHSNLGKQWKELIIGILDGKTFCDIHKKRGEKCRDYIGGNIRGNCFKKASYCYNWPDVFHSDENDYKAALLWLFNQTYRYQETAGGETIWHEHNDEIVKSIVDRVFRPAYRSIFTWSLRPMVAPPQVNIAVGRDMVLKPDVGEITKAWAQDIATNAALENFEFPIISGGDCKKVEYLMDTFLSSDKSVTFMQMEGVCSGWAFGYNGSVYSCHHVTRGNKIVLKAWANTELSSLMRLDEEGKLACKFEFNASSIKTTFAGDVVVYGFNGNASIGLPEPELGGIHQIINPATRQWATLICREQFNDSESTRGTYHTFSFCDISNNGTCKPVAFANSLRGFSGLPICNAKGVPVAVYGFLRVKNTIAGPVDWVEAARPLRVDRLISDDEMLQQAIDVLSDVQSYSKDQRWVRLQAATGFGKSTKFVLALGEALRAKSKKAVVNIVVCEPNVITVDGLYTYMTSLVQKDSKYCRYVNIRKSHGRLEKDVESLPGDKKRKINITYQTYGKFNVMMGDDVSDLIILDEIHTRNDADVQAVEKALMAIGAWDKVLTVTATTWAENPAYPRFVDKCLPGSTTRYPINERVLKKTKSEDVGVLVIQRSEKEAAFGFPEEELAANCKALVFCATKNECAFGASKMGQVGVATHVLTSETAHQPIPAGRCVIFCTDVVESGVTIDNVQHVIDFRQTNKPVVSLDFPDSESSPVEYTRTMGKRLIDKCGAIQRKGRTGRVCEGCYWIPEGIVDQLDDMEDEPTATMAEAALNLVLNGKVGGRLEDYLQCHPVFGTAYRLSPDIMSRRTCHRPFMPGVVPSRAPAVEARIKASEAKTLLMRKIKLSKVLGELDFISFYLSPVVPDLFTTAHVQKRLVVGPIQESARKAALTELMNQIAIPNDEFISYWPKLKILAPIWENVAAAVKREDPNEQIQVLFTGRLHTSLPATRDVKRPVSPALSVVGECAEDAGVDLNSDFFALYAGAGLTAASLAGAALVFRQFYSIYKGEREVTRVFCMGLADIDRTHSGYEYLTALKLVKDRPKIAALFSRFSDGVVKAFLWLIRMLPKECKLRVEAEKWSETSLHGDALNEIIEKVVSSLSSLWESFKSMPVEQKMTVFGNTALFNVGVFYDTIKEELGEFGAFALMASVAYLLAGVAGAATVGIITVSSLFGYFIRRRRNKPKNFGVIGGAIKQAPGSYGQITMATLAGTGVQVLYEPMMALIATGKVSATTAAATAATAATCGAGNKIIKEAMRAATPNLVERLRPNGDIANGFNAAEAILRLLDAGTLFRAEAVGDIITAAIGLMSCLNFNVSSMISMASAFGAHFLYKLADRELQNSWYRVHGNLKPGGGCDEVFVAGSKSELDDRRRHLKMIYDSITCLVAIGLNPINFPAAVLHTYLRYVNSVDDNVGFGSTIEKFREAMTTHPLWLMLDVIRHLWSRVSTTIQHSDSIAADLVNVVDNLVEPTEKSRGVLQAIGSAIQMFGDHLRAISGWLMKNTKRARGYIVSAIMGIGAIIKWFWDKTMGALGRKIKDWSKCATDAILLKLFPLPWLRLIEWFNTPKVTTVQPSAELLLRVGHERFVHLMGYGALMDLIPEHLKGFIFDDIQPSWEMVEYSDVKAFNMFVSMPRTTDLAKVSGLLKSSVFDIRDVSGFYNSPDIGAVIKYFVDVMTAECQRDARFGTEQYDPENDYVADNVHMWRISQAYECLLVHNKARSRMAFVVIDDDCAIVFDWGFGSKIKIHQAIPFEPKRNSLAKQFLADIKGEYRGALSRAVTSIFDRPLEPNWEAVCKVVARLPKGQIENAIKKVWHCLVNPTILDHKMCKSGAPNKQVVTALTHLGIDFSVLNSGIEKMVGMRTLKTLFPIRSYPISKETVPKHNNPRVFNGHRLTCFGPLKGFAYLIATVHTSDLGLESLVIYGHLFTGLPCWGKDVKKGRIYVCDFLKPISEGCSSVEALPNFFYSSDVPLDEGFSLPIVHPSFNISHLYDRPVDKLKAIENIITDSPEMPRGTDTKSLPCLRGLPTPTYIPEIAEWASHTRTVVSGVLDERIFGIQPHREIEEVLNNRYNDLVKDGEALTVPVPSDRVNAWRKGYGDAYLQSRGVLGAVPISPVNAPPVVCAASPCNWYLDSNGSMATLEIEKGGKRWFIPLYALAFKGSVLNMPTAKVAVHVNPEDVGLVSYLPLVLRQGACPTDEATGIVIDLQTGQYWCISGIYTKIGLMLGNFLAPYTVLSVDPFDHPERDIQIPSLVKSSIMYMPKDRHSLSVDQKMREVVEEAKRWNEVVHNHFDGVFGTYKVITERPPPEEEKFYGECCRFNFDGLSMIRHAPRWAPIKRERFAVPKDRRVFVFKFADKEGKPKTNRVCSAEGRPVHRSPLVLQNSAFNEYDPRVIKGKTDIRMEKTSEVKYNNDPFQVEVPVYAKIGWKLKNIISPSVELHNGSSFWNSIVGTVDAMVHAFVPKQHNHRGVLVATEATSKVVELAAGEIITENQLMQQAMLRDQLKLLEEFNQTVFEDEVYCGEVPKDFAVHFESVEQRYLPGNYLSHGFADVRTCLESTKTGLIKIEERTAIRPSEQLPIGLPIRPLERHVKLPNIEDIDLHFGRDSVQCRLNEISHISGIEWEVMAGFDRIYKPKNTEVPAASRGWEKALAADEDLGIFSNSHSMLDMTAGFGGLCQYYTHAPRSRRLENGKVVEIDGTTKVLGFNSLKLGGHAQPIVDMIIDEKAMEEGKLIVRQFAADGCNGDIRDQRTLELAINHASEFGVDLIVFDCGEASNNVKNEAAWMTQPIPIAGSSREYAFTETIAGAIEEYLKLVSKGGSAYIKMMGFTDVTAQLVRRFSHYFRRLICYKNPTTSLMSREWYLVLLNRDPELDQQEQFWEKDNKGRVRYYRRKPGRKVASADFDFEAIVNGIKLQWLRGAARFTQWAKHEYNRCRVDRQKYGTEGLGRGDVIDSSGRFLSKEQLDLLLREISKRGRFETIDNALKKFGFRRRWYCKQYYRALYLPDNTWSLAKPRNIDHLLKDIEKKLAKATGVEEEWSCYGETFKSRMSTRVQMIKAMAKQRYGLESPSGRFENVHEAFKIRFKNKVGKEKHTANALLSDQAYYVFGLTQRNATIGHTQCTPEMIYLAHKKRLDIKNVEPAHGDAQLLLKAMKGIMTPECKRLAALPDEQKFKPFSYEDLATRFNRQGSGGHFDVHRNFGEFYDDPNSKVLVEERLRALANGETVPTYQVCRDKRETKAKKNIDATGRVCLSDPNGEEPNHSRIGVKSDPRSAYYKRASVKERADLDRQRKEELTATCSISPRNIRFAEYVQRMADLCLLGPVQDYHANVAKLYYGSTPGVPLWLLGNLLKATHDVYCPENEQEFWEVSNARGTDGRLLWEKQLFDVQKGKGVMPESVYIKMYDPQYRERMVKRATGMLLASGDFSGWDGTVSKTDLVLNYLFYKQLYNSAYHPMLKTRFEHWMWAIVITDLGNVLLCDGQRSSGDQDTSFGNTMLNAIYHFAATALALGTSIEEASTPIGEIWYTADFGGEPKWKCHYLHRISHTADGDDNTHMGEADDIRLLDANGPMFLERCGKKIRCGTRAGYSLSSSFAGLSYCSHSYRRVRLGHVVLQDRFGKTVERPIGLTAISARPSVPKSAGLPQQHQVDIQSGLRVRYLPFRCFPEILGKLVHTMKRCTTTIDLNRQYGWDKKEVRRSETNEFAISVTRGKLLSYLLNYSHLSFVRQMVGAALGFIGDGACDLDALAKRCNVPSTVKSIESALRSVFRISDIHEIETISPKIEREGLKAIRDNTYLEFGTIHLHNVGTVAPLDLTSLHNRLKDWMLDFAIRYDCPIDWSYWLMAQPNLTPDEKNEIQEAAVDEGALDPGNKLRMYMSVLTFGLISSMPSESRLGAILKRHGAIGKEKTKAGKKIVSFQEWEGDVVIEVDSRFKAVDPVIDAWCPSLRQAIVTHTNRHKGNSCAGSAVELIWGRRRIIALITRDRPWELPSGAVLGKCIQAVQTRLHGPTGYLVKGGVQRRGLDRVIARLGGQPLVPLAL